MNGIVLTQLFIIEEEEGLLFLDRTAEGKAVLIASVIGLGDALGVAEKVVGIEPRTLAEPPTAAVEPVAALFQDDIDDGAAVVAEFRGEAVVFDFEFLNDFDRGLVLDVRR